MSDNSTRPAQFTGESARRIANVVRTSELTPRAAKPLTFDALFQSRRFKLIIGKAATDIEKGQVGTVDVWDGPSLQFQAYPTESDPPRQLEHVRNPFGKVLQGEFVAVMSATDGRRYILAAEEC